MMSDYRLNPPKQINKSNVIVLKDYQSSLELDLRTKTEKQIDLPKSNVLQFFLEDGTKISVRPSGTEPKIKFYISVKDDFSGDIDADISKAQKMIEDIKKDMDLF